MHKDVEVRLYFNFDQSKKSAREAGAARGLARIVRSMLPDSVVRIIESSTILVDNSPLARVTAKTPDVDVEVQYIQKTMDKNKVDKVELKRLFAEGSTRPPAEDEWSCL